MRVLHTPDACSAPLISHVIQVAPFCQSADACVPACRAGCACRLSMRWHRLAYGKHVVARGPELVSSSFAGGSLTITFSNSSMVVHKGVVVPPPPSGCANQTFSSAVTQISVKGTAAPVPFKIAGDTLVVECAKGTEQQPVLINGDASTTSGT
jgi:hypothetical protein